MWSNIHNKYYILSASRLIKFELYGLREYEELQFLLMIFQMFKILLIITLHHLKGGSDLTMVLLDL